VVGQQDRRHSAFAPFLTGRALDKVAGEFPVWTTVPPRAQDLPGAIARAWHEARAGSGPALVVAPMGDWDEPADTDAPSGSPARLLRTPAVSHEAVAELAALLGEASAPALVVGAGADSRAGWDALTKLAERLGSPVWQEPFGSRAGFPQDHRLFAGHLHWRRSRLRATLAPHDLVVAVGTNAFRLYLYEPGRLLEEGTRVAVITEDPEEAHRSPCDLALVASPAEVCAALAERAAPRRGADGPLLDRPAAPDAPSEGEPLTAGHVLAALAERLPRDAVLMEESPSCRPELLDRIPAREPLGFISTANGGLGFGLAGAIGLRMALPGRPVVAVVGDGSSLYSIQALWSAARYSVGVLFVVMANGRYAVMDELATDRGGAGAWPGFEAVDVGGLARALGCPACRVERHEELIEALDEALPTLADRVEPLLLDVRIA
jgi:thiamine pyrophosphate-dependent acetolactate synthase large subunit-like protein